MVFADSPTRKHYTAEDKVAILRRHLLEGAAVSALCDELGLQPTVFYRWQKEFFENAVAAGSGQSAALLAKGYENQARQVAWAALAHNLWLLTDLPVRRKTAIRQAAWDCADLCSGILQLLALCEFV